MRPQGEKTPHNSQRIGALLGCSDLQVRFLCRQGPVAGAEHRQTKQARQRALCCLRLTVPSVQIVARQQSSAALNCRLRPWTVVFAPARGPSRVTASAAQSLRGALRHWLCALHCCPSLLCADLRRGTARLAAVALPAGAC